MNNAPSFHKTLSGTTGSHVDATRWDKALQLFDARDYLASVHTVIDYANPELRKKYGNESQDEFHIPHGSVIVHLSLKNNTVTVRVPFLELPQTNVVPLLRQITQINFQPLNLAQIQLNGQQLEFFFSCPLELAEPYKLYYVFRDICHYADIYDDDFTEKFGAKRLIEPKIIPYAEALAEQAWQDTQQNIKEGLEYLNYFESKRWYFFCWDILMITIQKIEYHISPQGMLRNELEKGVRDMNGKDNSNERVSRGKALLLKFQNMPKEQFVKDLYKAEIFIPYKWRTSLQNIQDNIRPAYEQAQKEMNSKDHIGVCMTVIYNYYNLYYDNNIEDDIASVINSGLESASNKPWAEASGLLFNSLERIMKGDITISQVKTPAPEKKGWLSSLFGK